MFHILPFCTSLVGHFYFCLCLYIYICYCNCLKSDKWFLILVVNVLSVFKVNGNTTAKNTVILLDFLVWKFCGKAQFPHSFGRITRNNAETVSFRKISTPRNQVKLLCFLQCTRELSTWSINLFPCYLLCFWPYFLSQFVSNSFVFFSSGCCL